MKLSKFLELCFFVQPHSSKAGLPLSLPIIATICACVQARPLSTPTSSFLQDGLRRLRGATEARQPLALPSREPAGQGRLRKPRLVKDVLQEGLIPINVGFVDGQGKERPGEGSLGCHR